MKKAIITFLIGLPVVAGLYTLCEYLYCTFITGSVFAFDIKVCGSAVGVWLVVVLVLYFLKFNKES